MSTPSVSAQYVISAPVEAVQASWLVWTDGWALGRADGVTITGHEQSGDTVATAPPELAHQLRAMLRYWGFI